MAKLRNKKVIAAMMCGMMAISVVVSGCSSGSVKSSSDNTAQSGKSEQSSKSDTSEQDSQQGKGPGKGQAPAGGPGGQSSKPSSYSSVKSIISDTEESGKTYSSTGTDENAVNISNGANVTLKNATVTRTSSDSTGGDNASFYGVGAAILNTDATAVIKNGSISTDAAGGTGIFSYGDGVTYVSDTNISTKQDTSGGLHVAVISV